MAVDGIKQVIHAGVKTIKHSPVMLSLKSVTTQGPSILGKLGINISSQYR